MPRYGYFLSSEEHSPAEEALNEHITGRGWPAAQVRLEMLEEAIDVIRKLFRGGLVTHSGAHYAVETAQGGVKVCWGPDAGLARKEMHRLWPNDLVPGEAAQLLPLPGHFGQVSQLVTGDMITAPCGPDVGVHLRGVRAYTDAGFGEVYINQVGASQDGFFEFYATDVLPGLRGA